MFKKLRQKLHYGEEELSVPERKIIRDKKGEVFGVLAGETAKKQEEKNAYGLDKKYVDAILWNILFSNKMTDGSFFYAWDKNDPDGLENGSTKFSAIAKSYLYKKNINENEEFLYKDDELDIILSHITKDKKTHIELGPESGRKFIQYSDQRDPEHMHLKDKKYIGIDVSSIYADMANKNVEKIQMKGESVSGDRFQHSIFDMAKDQIYYFFGGSICNLDVGWSRKEHSWNQNKTIIRLLKRMKSNQPFSSVSVVITYFEQPEKNDPDYHDKVDKRKATYGSKDNPKYFNAEIHAALSDFILSGMEALGLERSKLEFAVKYQESYMSTPAMIKLGVKCRERIEIQISDSKVVKEAGEYLRAMPSQRFTKGTIGEMAKEAGFIVKYQKSRDGVGVVILQSKIGINDKFTLARNIVGGLLIGATVLGGGFLWQNYHKHTSIQEKIRAHEKKSEAKKSIVYLQNINKINHIYPGISQEFIHFYDKGNLQEDVIRAGIQEYLLREDINHEWLDVLYTNPNDQILIYNFLYHFVNEFFYKKMFENGSKDLHVLPFLQGMEAKFIQTLAYDGPIREGYDTKENVYYMIYGVSSVSNYEEIQGLENVELVSGYMLKQTGKVNTIHVNGMLYDRNIVRNADIITISKTQPDKNDYITVKRFVLDENINESFKKIKDYGIPMIFVNTHQEVGLSEYNNLMVNKGLIVDCFEENNPIFNTIWERYKQKYGVKKSYIGRVYYADEDHQKIEIAMITDLHKNNVFGIPNVSEYTDEIIEKYIDEFHTRYTKQTTTIP